MSPAWDIITTMRGIIFSTAAPDENGVITYEISGKVDVTDTGWVQVAKAGLADLSKVAFVGINDDAEICITGGLAILADQKYDIDVSFTNLKLSKPNPTYGGDYGHSTNYFTCWLRNTGAAENTVTYTNCVFPNGVCNNQTLLGRMGNRCCCGCIRCRAHTCFVRVQTALHAVHDAAAEQ